MPWWVVTVDRDLMGPYWSVGRAEEVRDQLDVEAKVRETKAEKRSEAVQELRHEDVQRNGIAAGHRNYKHGGGRCITST